MKVNLKIKKDNTVETIQHEVEEVNLLQITRTIKVVKDVLKMAQNDSNLQSLIEEIFEDEGEDVKELDNLDNHFIQKLIGAMDVLLEEVPDKAFELLSILSNIDHDVFMQQNLEDALDIYDAIIQVNDIDKLINRAKKSLALTKAQVKVMNIFPKKKQTEPKLV